MFWSILFALNSVLKFVASTGLIDAPSNGSDIQKLGLFPPYSIYRRRMTWGDAQNFCEKKEGRLATFINLEAATKVVESIYKNSEEVSADFMTGKKKSEFGLNRRYWIGLTDMVTGEGQWVWVGTGVPLTYNNMWYAGQPDHVDENGTYLGRPEHCVLLWNPVFHKGGQRHSFADAECDRKYYFICEEDKTKLEAQSKFKQVGRGIFFRPRNRTKHQNNRSGTMNVGSSRGEDSERDSKSLVEELKGSKGFHEIFESSEERAATRRKKDVESSTSDTMQVSEGYSTPITMDALRTETTTLATSNVAS